MEARSPPQVTDGSIQGVGIIRQKEMQKKGEGK